MFDRYKRRIRVLLKRNAEEEETLGRGLCKRGLGRPRGRAELSRGGGGPLLDAECGQVQGRRADRQLRRVPKHSQGLFDHGDISGKFGDISGKFHQW